MSYTAVIISFGLVLFNLTRRVIFNTSGMSILCFVFLLWGILTRSSSGSKGVNKCGVNQWQCLDGSCILMVGRCDNFPDCPDQSDETGCLTHVCNEGQRQCSSGECIDVKKFCDGVVHCMDAGDELAADCRGMILTTATGTATITNTKKYTIPWQTWTSPGTTRKFNTPLRPTHTTKYPGHLPTWLPPVTTIAPNKQTVTTYQPPPPPIPIETTTRSQKLITWPTWHPQTAKNTKGPLTTTTISPVKPERETTTKTVLSPVSSTSNWFHSGYIPTTSRTPCVLVEDYYEFCRMRYRGYHRHPQDCKQYIVCEWAFMHICRCPTKTHWDMRVLTCVWDYMAPCIIEHDNETITQEPRIHVIIHSITTSGKPSSTTTKLTEATTSTTVNPTTTTAFIPPPIRLRALPATPAWLKELSERTFLTHMTAAPPRFPSLLTRFFKAIPVNEQNIRIN